MKVQDLEKTLDSIRAWILAVDQKTNIVLVLELALITLISKPTYDLLAANKDTLSAMALALLSVSFVLFAASLVKLLLAIKPRVKAKGIDSLIFFGFIAKRSLADYRQEVARASARSYKADLVTQIHTTSVISSAKHTNYNDGVIVLPLALLAWLAFVVSVWLSAT